MPARGVQRVVLSDYKAKRRDEGAVEIETEDGQVFRIDPPELWPDDIQENLQSGNNIAIARALIGERYDDFVASGGSANLLVGVLGSVHGVSVGESSASSSS